MTQTEKGPRPHHSLREQLGSLKTYRIGFEQAVSRVFSLTKGTFVTDISSLLAKGYAPVYIVTSVSHKDESTAFIEGDANWSKNPSILQRLGELSDQCSISIRSVTRSLSMSEDFRTPVSSPRNLIRVPFQLLSLTRTEGWAFREHFDHLTHNKPNSPKTPFRVIEKEFLRPIVDDLINGIVINNHSLSQFPARVHDGLYCWLKPGCVTKPEGREEFADYSTRLKINVGFGMEDSEFMVAPSIESFNPQLGLTDEDYKDLKPNDIFPAMGLLPLEEIELPPNLDAEMQRKAVQFSFYGPGGEEKIPYYRCIPFDPLKYQLRRRDPVLNKKLERRGTV